MPVNENPPSSPHGPWQAVFSATAAAVDPLFAHHPPDLLVQALGTVLAGNLAHCSAAQQRCFQSVYIATLEEFFFISKQSVTNTPTNTLER